MPFGPIPAHVQDDPNHEWWSSEEAASLLQSLKDGAHQGVKPGGNPKPRVRPSSSQWPSPAYNDRFIPAKFKHGFDDAKAQIVAANLLEDDEDPKDYVMRKLPKYEPPNYNLCDECGKDTGGDGLSCPDGAYICHDCFNAGLH